MKSRDDVERRLRHLRVRYTTQFVNRSQERRHRNCVHNYEHVPRDRPAPPAVDAAMMPRKQVTLVVMQPDSPVRLCMYGSEDPSNWPGNVCDADEVAGQCPWFKPLQSAEDAKTDFEAKLADDEWVMENHKDVATLQWVLGGRVHAMGLSWFDRLLVWLSVRKAKVPPVLPAPPDVSVPDDLWEEK